MSNDKGNPTAAASDVAVGCVQYCSGDAIARLENWSVTDRHPHEPGRDDRYRAPERCHRYLAGQVYGDRRKPDGSRVVTSPILRSVGKRVTTQSGSVYELGTPDPRFLDYLHDSSIEFDADDPLGKCAAEPFLVQHG